MLTTGCSKDLFQLFFRRGSQHESVAVFQNESDFAAEDPEEGHAFKFLLVQGSNGMKEALLVPRTVLDALMIGMGMNSFIGDMLDGLLGKDAVQGLSNISDGLEGGATLFANGRKCFGLSKVPAPKGLVPSAACSPYNFWLFACCALLNTLNMSNIRGFRALPTHKMTPNF